MRYKIYGQKVRELREKKGLSQRGFAKMVELPYMTLRRIEDKNFDNKEGLSCFRVDEKAIQTIANCLETSFENLIPSETKEKIFCFIRTQRVLLQEVRLYINKEFGFEIQDEQIIPFLFGIIKNDAKTL